MIELVLLEDFLPQIVTALGGLAGVMLISSAGTLWYKYQLIKQLRRIADELKWLNAPNLVSHSTLDSDSIGSFCNGGTHQNPNNGKG